MKNFDEYERMFQKNWLNQGEFVVIPYTIRARSYLPVLKTEINIKVILDNNQALNDTFYDTI